MCSRVHLCRGDARHEKQLHGPSPGLCIPGPFQKQIPVLSQVSVGTWAVSLREARCPPQSATQACG